MKELFITNNSEYDLVVRPRSNRTKEVMFTAKVNTHRYKDGRDHAEDEMDREFHSHHRHHYGSGGDGDLHSSVAKHRSSWYLNSLIGNDSTTGNSNSGIGNNGSSNSGSNNNDQNITSFSMRDDNHRSVNDDVSVGVDDIQGIDYAINDNRENHDDRTQDHHSFFHSTHEQSVVEKTISEVRVSAHSSFRLCVYYSPSLDDTDGENDDIDDDGDDDGDNHDESDNDSDESGNKNRMDNDEDEDIHGNLSTIHKRMNNNHTTTAPTSNTTITTSTSSSSTTKYKSKSKTNIHNKSKKRKLLRNPNYLDLHQDDFYLLFELQSPREYGEISLFCHVAYCHSFVEADSEIRFSRCESGESYTKEWIIQNRVSKFSGIILILIIILIIVVVEEFFSITLSLLFSFK